MIITAKFASVCPACSGRISAGSKVEWSKGEKARHVACPAGGAAAAPAPRRSPPRKPSAPRGPSFPVSAPEAGAHQIVGRRTGRGDARYTVGQVIHAPKVSTPGGGPDSAYYVVLACHLWAPNEDMGHYDWSESAWVRAATAEEAETKAAQLRRAEAPKTVRAYLVAQIKAGERIPEAEANGVIPATVDAKVSTPKDHDLHAIALAGDVVVGYHGGYYDDYRAVAWRCTATPTLALAIRALASGNADELAVAADAVRS